MRSKVIFWLVIAALTAILFGSASHVIFTFQTLDENGYAGIVTAIGIEASLILEALAVLEMRNMRVHRAEQSEFDSIKKRMFWYAIFFSLINFFGNWYFGISRVLTLTQNVTSPVWDDLSLIDNLDHVKILLTSGSLPLMTWALTDTMMIYDARIKAASGVVDPERTAKDLRNERDRKRRERLRQQEIEAAKSRQMD